jgi:excisionase family DNA binding protein
MLASEHKIPQTRERPARPTGIASLAISIILFPTREGARGQMPKQVNGIGATSNEARLLTRAEVARLFQVSASTITRWAEGGKLPCVRTLGGHRRYDEKAIMTLARQLAGKEEVRMEKTGFEVPSMYADHHVIAVRKALMGLDGVEDVYASSAWQQVLVSYDPGKIDQATIEKVLADAGYPVGDGQTPMLVSPGKRQKDPAWDMLGARVTRTNQADIRMSGEFRKY